MSIKLAPVIVALVLVAAFASPPLRGDDGEDDKSGGGPVIVIDPGDGSPFPPGGTRPTTWTVKCKADYPVVASESGSIARRWFKSAGAFAIYLNPATGHPFDVSDLVLHIDAGGGKTRRLRIELMRPHFVPRWNLAGRDTCSARQELAEFPKDMLGRITRIEADGATYQPGEVTEIRIVHNELSDENECK